jgi:hypothetical protein
MGRSTCSDVVKNVAYIGDLRYMDALSPILSFYARNEHNGWILAEDTDCVGKKERLYATPAAKENMTVYIINVSEYASGGVDELVVFGRKRADVKAFLEDFGIKSPIEDEDSICQTM